MKKISMLLVLAAVSFSFVACGGGSKAPETTPTDSTTVEAPVEPVAPVDTTAAPVDSTATPAAQ